jgi:hypothetical protein
MSASEVAMAARMYPSMTPSAPAVVAMTATPTVRENKGIRLQAGDNSPNAEVQPNRGMGLQVGIDEPINDEQAALPTNPIKEPPEAVTVPDAPAILTEEMLAAAVPPELQAERDARGNLYENTYSHLLRADLANPQHAVVNREIGRMFSDHAVSAEDAGGIVYLGRKYADNPPDEATLTSWRSMVSAGERSTAQAAMARNPIMQNVLRAMNIAESPQVIRLLSSSDQGRR